MDHLANEVLQQHHDASVGRVYYQTKLARWIRTSTWIEGLLLVSTSSALSGLWFFQNPPWELIWQLFCAAAAFLAILQRLLGTTNKVREYERRSTGYLTLAYDFDRMRRDIEFRAEPEDRLRVEFERLVEKRRMLDEPLTFPVDRKLWARIENQFPISGGDRQPALPPGTVGQEEGNTSPIPLAAENGPKAADLDLRAQIFTEVRRWPKNAPLTTTDLIVQLEGGFSLEKIVEELLSLSEEGLLSWDGPGDQLRFESALNFPGVQPD